MEFHCRYHPTRSAVLMCYQCATTVCPDCIPVWPDRGMPRCVSCRSEMEQLGISDYVKPFWQCFDRFFNFPWQKGNLIFMALALAIFVVFVPVPDAKEMVTPFEFIYRIIIWILYPSFIVAYFSAVAVKASDGSSEPPEIMKVWSNGGFSLLFKALVVISVFSMGLALIKMVIGPTAGLILTFIGAIFFPASIMLLFMEREISAAVNPGRILSVIQSIGWPYAFLWGLVMMLISGPEILYSLPEHIYQSRIYPLLFLMVNIYFGLVLFHMLGYVAFQYHFELGITLPNERIESLNAPRAPQKAVLIESELLIMDGNYESALKLLENFLQKQPRHEKVQQKLFNLTMAVTKGDRQLAVAENYLFYLISMEQGFKVVASLRQLMHYHADLNFQHFIRCDELKKFLQKEQEMDLIEKLSS